MFQTLTLDLVTSKSVKCLVASLANMTEHMDIEKPMLRIDIFSKAMS